MKPWLLNYMPLSLISTSEFSSIVLFLPLVYIVHLFTYRQSLNALFQTHRDPHHKPELALALSDPFEALCGFRPLADILAFATAIPELKNAIGESNIQKAHEYAYFAVLAPIHPIHALSHFFALCCSCQSDCLLPIKSLPFDSSIPLSCKLILPSFLHKSTLWLLASPLPLLLPIL